MDVTLDGVLLDRTWNDEELSAISIQVAAFDGEVGAGAFPIPDYLAAEDIYGGQQIKVVEGSVVLVNGTVDDQQRERHTIERITTRVQTFTVRDANALMYGYRNANWIRPAESDRARWLASAAKYNPSFDTSMVLGTGLVTMPAKTYDSDGGAGELIGDTIELAGKTVFVEESITGSRILHVHTLIEGDAAGITIDDTPGAYDGISTFYPGNPVRSKTPADLVNNVRARGTGVTSLKTNAASIAIYNKAGLRHEKLLDFPDAKTQSVIDAYATAALGEGAAERVTYEVTIGPLDETALALFRAGQVLAITSQALGLSASAQRISHVTYTVYRGKEGKPVPGLWDARFELGRPLRTHGPRRSSPAPVATAPGGGPGPGGAPCGPFDDWPGTDTTASSDECETFDSFNRTVSGNLGTSDVGLPWTETFNAGVTVSVNGTEGVFSSTSPFGGHAYVGEASAGSGQFWNNDSWSTVVEFTPEQVGMVLGRYVYFGFTVNDGGANIVACTAWAVNLGTAGDGSGNYGHVDLFTPDTGLNGDGDSDVQFAKTDWVAGTSYSIRLRKQGAFGYLTFWQTGDPEPGPQLAATITGAVTPDNVVIVAGTGNLAGIYVTVQDIQGCSTTPASDPLVLGSDWTIVASSNLSEYGSAGGSMFVAWADQGTETAISFVATRTPTMSPAYLLPTLGSGQNGNIIFTQPFSLIASKPGYADDLTAFASVRMRITLPSGQSRGIGAYIHDGAEYLEAYNGASWSTTGGLSESKVWDVDTLYTLKLDMSQARVTGSVTGGPEIDLTALSVWDPGTPPDMGSIGWEISVVGNVVYQSTVTIEPIDIRSISSTGATIPGFWCTAPEQTQVPGTFIANGNGTTTLFYTTTPYLAGSLAVTVDGTPQHAIETDPATGAFTLEFAPVAGEAIYASWAYSAAPPPPEGGFDTTGTRVWSTLVPSLASDQGSAIQSFIETQAAAGTVAAFNPGNYRVDARRTFSSIDNLRLWAPGVNFQRVSTSAGLHEILEFVNCNDLLIQGLTVTGPATDNDIRTVPDAYPREAEHAITLANVRRGTFRGVHCRNTFGDGWYMPRSNDADNQTYSDSLLWEDCDVITTGRNGWSLITGRNWTLRRCLARTCTLHGFDVEENRTDDYCDYLTLDDFSASDFDAGGTSSGHGQAVQIGPGYGNVAATNVTIRRLRMDQPYLRVNGPSSGDPHVNVTVTGTRSNVAGSGNITHVQGWVQSDNDGLSLPASGNVT